MNTLIIKIKASKHNVNILQQRGLFSDDSQSFFDMYESLLNEIDFQTKITSDSKFFIKELEDAKIKF